MMPARIAAPVFVLLSFWAASPAVAQDKEKPAFSIATKTIDASVTIEAKLRSYPGLPDVLLADGKRELAYWRRESEKGFKEMPEAFVNGRKYAFERSYRLRSAIGPYVSIVRLEYTDGLGAHPNHATNTILWDTRTRKAVSIRPLFKETATNGPTLERLAHHIRLKLAEQKKSRDIEIEDADTDPMLSQVKADLLHIGAAALVPSSEPNKSAGLIFYFSPYEVGSYAEGDYSAFVPWTDFKSDLSAKGAAVFGGERPQADEKDD
jgi:hypothetical protein